MENFSEFEQVGRTPRREFGDVISHAFDIFKKVLGYGVILMIFVLIMSWLFGSIAENVSGYDPKAVGEEMGEMIKNKDFNFGAIAGAPGLLQNSFISFIGGLLLFPMYAGFLFLCQKANNGDKMEFSDLFIGYRQNLGQLILYGLLSSLLMYIAMGLCFFPVIFVAPLFFIGLPIVFFENTTATAALSKSFNIAKNNYGTFLGLSIVSFLIAIAGVIACGIGILITFPFIFVAMYSAYCAYCGTPRQLVQN